MNPIIRTHNLETDEIVDYEMTDSEFSEYLKSLEPKPLTEDEAQAEADKAALLAKLGITADEAKLLLS